MLLVSKMLYFKQFEFSTNLYKKHIKGPNDNHNRFVKKLELDIQAKKLGIN